MNRFEQLTAQHLDGVATRDETDELSGLLERNAGAFSEFHAQFEMQELLTALHTPTDEARVDAVLNQLRHEADPFVESVARELRSARFEEPTSSWLERLLAWTAPRRITLAVCGATAVTLVACLWGWFLGPVMGEPTLAEVMGTDVFVERATELMVASNGMRMIAKDVLQIGTNSSAALAFGQERTTIKLASETELTLARFASGKRFQLRTGTLEASVSRQRPFQPMIIATPNAEARVLGTEFTLTVTTNSTRLDVIEGEVRLTRATGTRADVPAEHFAIASANYELAALPQTGSILREYWTNIAGGYYLTFLTTNSNFPDRPSGREFLKALAAPNNWGDSFGDRFRGYLIPPQTGDYTFWIAGNDGGELRLSQDSNPENAVQIAFANGTAPYEWSKSRSQQSAVIPLVAGRAYYIEVLRKCGVGKDHLAVAWQPPGGQREIIPGQYLAPVKTKPKK